MPVSSKETIEELIRAAYPLIYVVSPEESRVETTLKALSIARHRDLVKWSVTTGFEDEGNKLPSDVRDPIRALDNIERYEGNAIFVMRDFHPYLTDPVIVRKLRDLCGIFRTERNFKKHVVLLSPIFKAPRELEKDMAMVEYELPGRDQIDSLIMNVYTSLDPATKTMVEAGIKDESNGKTFEEFKEKIIDAALGLTAMEVHYVLSRSLVRRHTFDIDTILEEKKHIIRKSGILEFFEAKESWGHVGGLKDLKLWLEQRQFAFGAEARRFGVPMPKGILLIGVPGCGKSLTAKAVGALWKMPLLRLDVGKVFSSLVGSSEENIRRAIGTAEAVAPSILWLDELEKGFSGTKSSGETDGGTTARVFASFITWLQEKESQVFVIATANDVSMLPPELLRKGRFDEIFFVDLPSAEERAEIFRIMVEKLNKRSDHAERILSKEDIQAMTDATQEFSGSEIEQVIISALYKAFEKKKRGDEAADINRELILEAAKEIIPLSYTMKERIDEMRQWAKSRARMASHKKDDTTALPESKLEIQS